MSLLEGKGLRGLKIPTAAVRQDWPMVAACYQYSDPRSLTCLGCQHLPKPVVRPGAELSHSAGVEDPLVMLGHLRCVGGWNQDVVVVGDQKLGCLAVYLLVEVLESLASRPGCPLEHPLLLGLLLCPLSVLTRCLLSECRSLVNLIGVRLC